MTEDLESIRIVCRYVEQHSDQAHKLDALAAMAGLSKYHFARRFKAVVGVTPKEYAAAARLRRLKDGLKDDRSIDAAAYEAGYGSPSRVYENAARNLGMTPAQYRAAGQGVAISYAMLETPLGAMLIGATDRGICFAQFGDSEEDLARSCRRSTPTPRSRRCKRRTIPILRRGPAPLRAISQVNGRISTFRSTSAQRPFRCAFGSICNRSPAVSAIVPRGCRRYRPAGGCPGRGAAIARNPVALIIPCHRVIRDSGALGGYRWGLERKRTLLDIERAAQ